MNIRAKLFIAFASLVFASPLFAEKPSINSADIETLSIDELEKFDLTNMNSATFKRLREKLAPSATGNRVIYPDGTVVDEHGRVFTTKQQHPEQADENLGQLSPLEKFATQTFQHGVPYKEAIKYKGHDTTGLVRMLRDPRWKDSWSKIAFVLGIVGDEIAVEELINFSDEFAHSSDFQAREAALFATSALGYAIANYNSSRAIKWIKNRLEEGDQAGPAIRDKNRTGKQIDPDWLALRRSMMLSALGTAATPETIGVLNSYRGRLINSMKISKDSTLENEFEIVEMNLDRARQIQAAGGIDAVERHR